MSEKTTPTPTPTNFELIDQKLNEVLDLLDTEQSSLVCMYSSNHHHLIRFIKGGDLAILNHFKDKISKIDMSK